MVRNKKVVITFIISLIIAYLIVGYLKSNVGVAIDWVKGVTLIQKLNEYYIRTFWDNIILSLVVAVIPTLIVMIISRKKEQS